MSVQQVSVGRPLPSLDYGVGAGVALLVAGLIGFGLAKAGSVPLRMDVYGQLGRINIGRVHELGAPLLGNGFFQLDSQVLEARLRELPWVRTAVVERLWPDRVAVHLQSHEAIALWGDSAVLTTDGEIIQPEGRPELALQVVAPAERAGEVHADLQVVLTSLPTGWTLREWRLSATGDRTARIERDGSAMILEFGREPVAEKFHLLADVALPVLQPRLAEVAAVDLRYRNGFAVRWRDGSGKED